jgi:hypothetical protein
LGLTMSREFWALKPNVKKTREVTRNDFTYYLFYEFIRENSKKNILLMNGIRISPVEIIAFHHRVSSARPGQKRKLLKQKTIGCSTSTTEVEALCHPDLLP